MNVCVPPKSVCWKYNTHSIGKYGLWEGLKSMNRINALVKETPQSSLAPNTMWGTKQKGTMNCKALTKHQIFWYYDPGFPKSKFLLFLSYPPSICDIVIAAQMDQDTNHRSFNNCSPAIYRKSQSLKTRLHMKLVKSK